MGKEKVVEKVVIAHEKAKDTARKDHHDFHDALGPLHVSRNLPVKAAEKARKAPNVENTPVNAMENHTTPTKITGMRTKLTMTTTYPSQLPLTTTLTIKKTTTTLIKSTTQTTKHKHCTTITTATTPSPTQTRHRNEYQQQKLSLDVHRHRRQQAAHHTRRSRESIH